MELRRTGVLKLRSASMSLRIESRKERSSERELRREPDTYERFTVSRRSSALTLPATLVSVSDGSKLPTRSQAWPSECRHGTTSAEASTLEKLRSLDSIRNRVVDCGTWR